jgi:hypothetical protein
MSFSRRQEIKKTRKEHFCFFCASKIAAGEPATYFTGTVDGDFYADYNHQICTKIWDFIRAHDLVDCGDGVEEGFINEVMDEMEHDCSTKEEFLEFLKTQINQNPNSYNEIPVPHYNQ